MVRVSQPATPAASASPPSVFLPWLREAFQGVTWGRFGYFCAFCAWIALYSYPTAFAVAQSRGIEAVASAFLSLYFLYFIVYGPALLAIVVIGSRHAMSTGHGIVLSVIAIVIGGLWSAIVGTWLFSDGQDGWTRPVAIAAASLQGMIELGLAAAAFLLLTRRDRANATLHQEEVDRIGLDRELAEARLQVLQSQIEPHFLFNTLANIRRLLQTDRATGEAMLHEFARYVEPRLPQWREARSTLGRELALTLAYLNVQQIRMGPRLDVRLSIPHPLEAAAFPPMMLMTLVENALKHGLAPLPDGGSVSIVATHANDRLAVQVIDTGVGLGRNAGPGIGIANTRARLRTMFGGSARLSVTDNKTGGVTATIELPCSISGPEATPA
jgi:sensor histidine kinase YesM